MQRRDETPPIKVTQQDLERLRQVAARGEEDRAPMAAYLTREIGRAKVVPHSEAVSELVMIGSRVDYLDNASGFIRTVRLVLPEDAELDRSHISILSPAGAALIGLSTGQTIRYPVPGGEWRSLTVIEVDNTGM